MTGAAEQRRRVNSGLLALSIVVTVLCCIPLGAVAITYATRGEDDRAKKWVVAAIAGGVATLAIVLAVRA